MQPTGGSVAAFIAEVTPALRQRDAQTLVAMMRELSGREPELWGTIIGFGSCHYRYPTGNEGDSPIIGFAPRKTASTIYLIDGVRQYETELTALGAHKTGVGCLYLKDLEKIDEQVLRGIVERSYAFVLSGDTTHGTLDVTG
ncbi:DUF1801 domain-containing protein (plasmid) [Coraliomargarita sp. W4R53]